MRVETSDIMDREAVAERLGVSSQAVTNWMALHEDFVACMADCEYVSHPLFVWSKVRRWAIKTGRLEKSAA